MERGTQRPEAWVVAHLGVDAIAEHDHTGFLLGIDPQRAPGKGKVPDRAAGNQRSRERPLGRWPIPAQAPGRVRDSGRLPELAQHLGPHQGGTTIHAPTVKGSTKGKSELKKILDTAEQSGMSRDAAHGEGIQIVDLAEHEPAAHWTAFGGRDIVAAKSGRSCAREQIHEAQAGKAQGLEKQALGQDIQARGHGLLDQGAKQDEAQIRIDGPAAWLIGQRLGGCLLDDKRPARLAGLDLGQVTFIELAVGGKAARMGQDSPQCDLRPVFEHLKVVAKRSIQMQAPFFHTLHDQQTRDYGLGQRGEIVDCVDGRGSGFGVQLALPESLQKVDLAGLADRHDQPRNNAIAGGRKRQAA